MCQLPGNIPIFWLGSGNNTLVRDGGIKGVTLSPSEGLSAISWSEKAESLYVESGIENATLVRFCSSKGIEGLDFLASSPGTLGGAIAMSATQLDKWHTIKRLECVDRDGDLSWCELAELQDKLWTSDANKQAWIIGVEFAFSRPDQKHSKVLSIIKRVHSSVTNKKVAPTGIYQHSSEVDPEALLQKSGLAGFKVGGAGFNQLKPNQLAISKSTSVADVENLVHHGQQVVKRKFDIELSSLINFVGDRA